MADASPALIAKAALRRLAMQRVEPTPEQYARAWADEGGAPVSWVPERARVLIDRLLQRPGDDPARRAELVASLMHGRWDDLQRQLDGVAEALPSVPGWAALLERAVRGVERGGRHWTVARRKDSLQRVLDGSRHDGARLQQRLHQLLTSWEQDAAAVFVETDDEAQTLAAPAEAVPPSRPVCPGAEDPAPAAPAGAGVDVVSAGPAVTDGGAPLPDRPPGAWIPITQELGGTLRRALPADEPRARALADELGRLADRIAQEGATPALAAEVGAICERARRWFAHRHHLVEELAALCRELTAGLADLAEDASWARGQMQALGTRLEGGPSVRGVKAAAELLARTRTEQQRLRAERDEARDALRRLVESLMAQLGELDAATGRYGERLGRYEQAIGAAPSVGALSQLVQQMLEDNRTVRADVQTTRRRLADENARAAELESRVRSLENELRRLSDEVSTDALTQVANRRGLLQAFDAERSRARRSDAPAPLAVGLLDIDNFKKLNDSLGHAAGDQALKSLAARIGALLRPADTLGRWGGEEFVVLLPATAVDEAQQVLARLQRALTASLFLHEGREVFVTFSAGVTQWRDGEPIDAALERADEALYEAKRSGKNRTCVA